MALQFFKQYWKSILVFCFIFYASIMRIPPALPVLKFPHEDKLIHIMMYFTLTSIIYLDIFRAQAQFNRIILILIVVAFPILYGGILELLQGVFFPPRTADWFDFLADALGSSIAFLLMELFFKKADIKQL